MSESQSTFQLFVLSLFSVLRVKNWNWNWNNQKKNRHPKKKYQRIWKVHTDKIRSTWIFQHRKLIVIPGVWRKSMWRFYGCVFCLCAFLIETQPTADLTLVSNNNEWTPQILRNQIWVTLTHTPALPIHNGRNYQELKRESDTDNQPTVRLSLKESERERDRTLKKAHVIPECHNKH